MLRAFDHRVVTCCDMLGVVGSSLTLVKFEPTTPKMSQHIATRWPNARNMLRYVVLACCDRLAGALNLRGNTQVLLNETVALNSPLQFIKVDLFLHAVQLFSI